MEIADFFKFGVPIFCLGGIFYFINKSKFMLDEIQTTNDIDFIKLRMKALRNEITKMEEECEEDSEFKIESLVEYESSRQRSQYYEPNYLENVVKNHVPVYDHILHNPSAYKGVPKNLIDNYKKTMDEFATQVRKFDKNWSGFTPK